MKKITRNIAVFLLSIFIFTACGGEKQAETREKENKETFILGIYGNPNDINPVASNGRYGLMSVKQIFSPLFILRGIDDYEFCLATDFFVDESGTIYTVKLKEDILWQDGEPLTAEDVVFTFDVNTNDTNSQSYGVLQLGGNPMKVEALDDYTVQFTATKPNGIIPELISDIFIIPKHVYEDATDYSFRSIAPVGSGPYNFSEYKEGNSITFTKNALYYDGEPQIDNVIFKVFTDENSASLALQNGDINALVIQPTDIKKYEGKDITIHPYSENRVGYLSFNLNSTSGNEISNQVFREGVLTAINKGDLIKASFLSTDYATPLYSFLPPSASYNIQNGIKDYNHNPEKAKELVDSSGVNNKNLRLAYVNNDTTYKKMSLLIQENLKKIGVNLELVPIDGTAMFNSLIKKDADFDMYLGGYIMGIDPENYTTLFHSEGQANYSGYKNSEVDQLFIDGVNETDSQKRTSIYAQLQKLLIADAFFYPIADNKRIIAVTNNVGGVEDANLVSIYGFEDMGKLFFK